MVIEPTTRVRPLDVNHMRRQFPILSREVHAGVPLTYLDSAATALKPNSVIETVAEHYRRHTASNEPADSRFVRWIRKFA